MQKKKINLKKLREVFMKIAIKSKFVKTKFLENSR